MLTDAIITLLAYLATAGGFLIWLYVRRPENIPRGARTVFFVCTRTLALFIVFFALFGALNVSILKTIPFLAMFLLLILLGLPSLFTGGSILLSVAVVLYGIQQWILGFPDREKLILQPPEPYRPPSPAKDIPALIGRSATTVTPLRPTGKILIDDKEYDATGESDFIPARTNVEITAIKNNRLTVRKRRRSD